MIEITTECLELLDHCTMAPKHKQVVRRNIMEIKKLLVESPSTAAKVDFFAKERFENLLAHLQGLGGGDLKAPEIYVLVGGTNTILKITRLLAREEQSGSR